MLIEVGRCLRRRGCLIHRDRPRRERRHDRRMRAPGLGQPHHLAGMTRRDPRLPRQPMLQRPHTPPRPRLRRHRLRSQVHQLGVQHVQMTTHRAQPLLDVRHAQHRTKGVSQLHRQADRERGDPHRGRRRTGRSRRGRAPSASRRRAAWCSCRRRTGRRRRARRRARSWPTAGGCGGRPPVITSASASRRSASARACSWYSSMANGVGGASGSISGSVASQASKAGRNSGRNRST